MIDHLFIKNFKAFKKENIPLDRNTLLIGTNASGKTTVLEALDLFFNNVFNLNHVRDKNEDVVIEIHINDERYRKVYTPPLYKINFQKCIGKMYEINHIKYLHIPTDICNSKFLNDILTVNLVTKPSIEELSRAVKVFDYIDGTLGNNFFDIYKIDTRYEMQIDKELVYSKDEYTKMISSITYSSLVIGIDNLEKNFIPDDLKRNTEYMYQNILTTNDKEVISSCDYFVHPLFKGNTVEDFEVIKPRVINHKKYLLVEGKYDVAWFEKGLKLLDKYDEYRVIPCGGFGNIAYVKQQLDKEGIKSIVITDGDTSMSNSLKEEIIELYADFNYINKRFNSKFKSMPDNKHEFFKRINVKDEVVKKVLSSWAKNNLTVNSKFVKELNTLI
jgi:AAA15 family ATPase/GTPase